MLIHVHSHLANAYFMKHVIFANVLTRRCWPSSWHTMKVQRATSFKIALQPSLQNWTVSIRGSYHSSWQIDSPL